MKRIVFIMIVGIHMIYGNTHNDSVQNMVNAWREFVVEIEDWQELVKPYAPHSGGCGIVYELPNFLNRPNEDFALVDMRNIPYTEPHYHPEGVVELYIVLCGSALIVVGTQEHTVTAGDAVVIPPLTAHFVIPDNDCVIAVINTPPYRPEDYIALHESNDTVCFDQQLFMKLCKNSD